MPVMLVFGMQGHRDPRGFLSPFAGIVTGLLAVPIPGAYEKTHEPAALAAAAIDVGIVAEPCAGLVEALDTLAAEVREPTRVLIAGSLYLAGHALALQAGTTVQGN